MLAIKRVPILAGPSLGAAVQEIGDAEFSQVLSAPKAVVKFYSPNCPYSRNFAPIYEAVGPQHPDVFFGAVNVLQHVQNAGKYGFSLLPTVIFFANGQEVGRAEGVQDQSDFLNEMSKAFTGAPSGGVQTQTVQRGGTAAPEAVTSGTNPLVYVAGGAAIAAALATAGYFIFKK